MKTRAPSKRVRELAEELGVDLDEVKGTGKDGRVLVKDVREAVGSLPERKRPAEQILNAVEKRGEVLEIFGAFGDKALLLIPTEVAQEVWREPLVKAGPMNVVEALERELAEIGKRAPDVANSSLAATAIRLAYELQNPFNSATSKSMCSRQLMEALERIRELAPPAKEADPLDELNARRAARRAGGAAA